MESIIFSRASGCPQLYLGDCSGQATAGGPRAAFLLPRGASGPATIDLATSWTSYPAGCYLFLPAPLDAVRHAAFAAKAWTYLEERRHQGARFAWFEDGPAHGAGGQSIALYQAAGVWYTDRLAQFDFGGILFLVGKACPVTLAAGGAGFRIAQPNAGRSALQTLSGRRYPLDGDLTLPVCGAAAGCLRFTLTLRRAALPDTLPDLDIGLQIFVRDTTFPAPEDRPHFLISLRYPVFSEDAQDWQRFGSDVTLHATLDPLKRLDGRRTYFSFISPSGPAGPLALPSCYRTNLGYTIHLTPRDHDSRLVFAPRPAANQPGDDSRYYLVPAGEFAMSVPRSASSASQSPHDHDNLLCGLSGVEYVRLEADHTSLLGFYPGCAAYAPGFTLGSSAANRAAGLTELATTAWAYVRQDGGTSVYYAQPDQAVLYQPSPSAPQGSLLSYMEVPAARLPDRRDAEALAFPLFPYSGAQADPARGIALADYREIELQRLNPIRRTRIHAAGAGVAAPTPALHTAAAGHRGTTPQGLLATFSDDYQTLQSLVLAKDTAGRELTLQNIEDGTPLRAALQSSQLFVVISDPQVLRAHFQQSRLTIAGWTFDLDPATWARHGTILVFKFHDKPIIELVANTQMWMLPTAFNARPEATRRLLAGLIQGALDTERPDANPKDRENYAQLVRAARTPGWSGVFALNVALSPGALPNELLALAAGINNDAFFAQYVGSESTPIGTQNGQLVAGQSSLFGLIDYRDDSAPLPTESGYNFQVTRLQVLFQNAQVKSFAAEVSVTLDRLFGERTALRDSSTGRNIVLFKGSAENQGGVTTYAFSFSGDNHFALPESHALNEVELIKAQFTTDPVAGPPGDTTMITGRFTFWGRLNFRRLGRFDALSFGAEEPAAEDPAEAENDRFLSFANLVVTISFVLGAPAERSFAFEPRGLAFDLQRSTARAESLYAKFPLKLSGFVASLGDQPLEDLGYMPVKTPVGGGKLEGTWYGLTFDLDLGTLGALVGKAGIVAGLLVAWSPGAERVFVGLRLPGSSGGKREIAIQGVLKISFKGIEFVAGAQGEHTSYLLKLKNITLKFLLLSIPPNGQAEIIIFGDPRPQGENNAVGWYAAYAKDPPPPPPPPRLTAET